jgi:hypothetical protein
VNTKIESKRLQEENNITFKPVIHTKPKPESTSANGGASANGGSRFDKLYSDAKKRQQESSNPHESKLVPGNEELTFKPQISARASSRSKRTPSPMNITDRLVLYI